MGEIIDHLHPRASPDNLETPLHAPESRECGGRIFQVHSRGLARPGGGGRVENVVKPRDRLWMHARHLREKLAELNLAIAPHLSILDGRRCFISGGPSEGELREPDVILASGDQIALDVEALKVIMGYEGHSLSAEPWELPMVRRSVELNLGARTEGDYRLVDGATGRV